MKRRAFMALIGGATVWPLAARAQQPAMQVVGYLHSATVDVFGGNLSAFHRGLREAGYVEGRNVTIVRRSASGHYDRLPALAADLVRRKVDVIFAQGLPAARAAKAATSTIPIVFTSGGDPVARGLVTSLSRPGGNVTGITMLITSLLVKRLELLREMKPGATTIALLVNPTNPNTESDVKKIAAASTALGVRLRVHKAATEQGIDEAFAALAAERTDILLVGGDPFFGLHASQVTAAAARVGVPAAYDLKLFVDAGGLVSYGASVYEAVRRAGHYAGRILDGKQPADLPVQQSTKIELIINLKTARALGMTIPPAILARADEVIE